MKFEETNMGFETRCGVVMSIRHELQVGIYGKEVVV
jgi:hypothetical protein